MGNYTATARTNYVFVKNEIEFKKIFDNISNISSFIYDNKKRIGMIFEEGIPAYFDDDTEIEWEKIISPHLKENEIMVFQEVGYEKARYIAGYVFAIAWNGEITHINLGDIYKQAESKWQVKSISLAEY